MIELTKTVRILVVHVINPLMDKQRALNYGQEVESLIYTLGGKIVDRVIQKLYKPDNSTYIGSGKVFEVQKKVKENKVDIVVLNAMAKPRQIHALKSNFEAVNSKIEVWDRVDLILNIFDKHATTTEAKLQIELARMRYMGPRIYGMGHVMSRQGGGIGTSGIGETNTELMKRHWRSAMKEITDQLDKLTTSKELQLKQRKRAGFKTASIVGYTNSGKSSLFNTLSKKNNLVENVLFATLDSAVGKLYIPAVNHEVLLTDTIGFIRNLPPRLINAFKSTLLESIHADVLLHVIDASDKELDIKIDVVNDVLNELGRDTKDIIYVFNKIDLVPKLNKEKLINEYHQFSPLFISVKSGKGVEDVKEIIKKRLTS